MMREKAEKPSEDLLKLIEFANLAPLKPTLPSSKFLIAKIYFEKAGKVFPQVQFDLHHSLDNSLRPNREEFEAHKEAEKEAFEEIKKITKKYPSLYHYVFDENEETIFNIHGQPLRFQQQLRYDGVLTIQKLLIKIAIHCTVFIERFGLKEFAQNSYPTLGEFVFPFEYQIKNGKLHFEITHITKTLEGIDARRLRFCKVCKKIFWAYRLDAKYCFDKCGNLFRVKKSLAEKAEKEKLKKEIREKQKNQNFSKKGRK